MNLYAHLGELDAAEGVNLPDGTSESQVLRISEAVSREIDSFCRRHFYVDNAAKIFQGHGDLLLGEDLISYSGITHDTARDGTFSTTVTTTYIHAEPYNRSARKLTNYPFYGRYEVTGKWGWKDETFVDDTLAAAIVSTTATTFTATGTMYAGQTILIDSEQMYITDVNMSTVTVKRGVNGTTAATHLISTDIYAYTYPAEVREACIMQVSRLQNRAMEGYINAVGITASGDRQTILGLDQDVKELLMGLKAPNGL